MENRQWQEIDKLRARVHKMENTVYGLKMIVDSMQAKERNRIRDYGIKVAIAAGVIAMVTEVLHLFGIG